MGAELFKEARKVKKKIDHNGKTWPVNGKIFLKTDITAKVLRIDSHEDLRKTFNFRDELRKKRRKKKRSSANTNFSSTYLVNYYNCFKCASLANTNELSFRPVGILIPKRGK